MTLDELKDWMTTNKFVAFGHESVDGCGNEEVQKIYSVDGKLFSVHFCNGHPTEKWSDKGYVRGVYEPEPVRAKHTVSVDTTYEKWSAPQSLDASKFKPLDVVELLVHLDEGPEFIGDVEVDPAKTHPAGKRGLVESVDGDYVTVQFGLDDSIKVRSDLLRILHSSPEHIMVMAFKYHRIRQWAAEQASILCKTTKSFFRHAGEPKTPATEALAIVRMTQPFATHADAMKQYDRTHGTNHFPFDPKWYKMKD